MSAGLPPPASDDAPTDARRIATRARRLGARLLGRTQRAVNGRLEDILDLFDEDVYSGEITADGHYIGNSEVPRLQRYIGGEMPPDVGHGAFWESRIHRDDWAGYERFNRQLLEGVDAEVTYRFIGLDGVTRFLWDRARPRRGPDGRVFITGTISDVTSRHEVAARLAHGQRSLHAAARRRGRARLPGRGASRRPAGGAVPGARRRPAPRRRRAGQRDGELGRGDPPRRPAGLRRVHRDPRRRARAPTSSTGCAAPTASRAGCTTAASPTRSPTDRPRSAASSPTSPSAAGCAPSWPRRMPRCRRWSRRWTPTCSRSTPATATSTAARTARR